MSFIADEKSYYKGLRGVLKKHENAAHDDEELQSASFLQSAVGRLLERNDLQSSMHVLSERLNNGGTVVKAVSRVLLSRGSYDVQQGKKQRIEKKLQDQAPQILASLVILKIDPPPYLLNLLHAGAVPRQLTEPWGSGRAAPPEQQLSGGASSTEGTPHSTSKKNHRYQPKDYAHDYIARAVRDVGVNASWEEVVARIDDRYEEDIPFIIPTYCSLPGNKRTTLLEAIKNIATKKRIQKIIRDVRVAIRHEGASRQ